MPDETPTPDAPPDGPTLELLHGCPVERPRGERVVFATRQQYLPLVQALADDGYDVCVDITAVDYLLRPARPLPAGVQPGRFEVVTNLLSMRDRQRLRVRVQVSADEPELPSLFDLHTGTEAFEREVFDMFGITFVGHPDLTRILMPEDWDGHPLRKDEAVGRIPVQFSHDEQGRAGEVVQGDQP